MRKQTLRVLLGVCYMCLLTTLLLYQAGVFGGRRVWTVAVLGTLFLGVSLAVVLALYLRVTDQIAKSKENPRTDQTERKPAAETYVLFLSVVENCTLSERSWRWHGSSTEATPTGRLARRSTSLKLQ